MFDDFPGNTPPDPRGFDDEAEMRRAVNMAGSSDLARRRAAEHVPAILDIWYPGSQGGAAVANLLLAAGWPHLSRSRAGQCR